MIKLINCPCHPLQHTFLSIGAAAVMLLALCFGGQTAKASPAIPCNFTTTYVHTVGIRLTARISSPADCDFYRVPLDAGKRYEFHVWQLGGLLYKPWDPKLTLFSPSGLALVTNDNVNTLTKNAIVSVVAKVTGNYLLKVEMLTGTSRSAYALTSSLFAPPAVCPANSVRPKRAVFIDDNISGNGDAGRYCFALGAGQQIRYVIRPKAGSANPLNYWHSYQVNSLDRPVGLPKSDAVVDFRAPTAGTYTFKVVGRLDDGDYQFLFWE